MASIFTEEYTAMATSIYNFFPHMLHTVPFTSLFLLWALVDICSCHSLNVQWGFCFLFSRWKSSNQSHCNLKSKVKMSIPLFGLPCWSLAVQNVGIHYPDAQKISEDVLPHFDWGAHNIIFHAHLIKTIYIIHISIIQLNVLYLIYLDHIMTQSPVHMNNISWVWICTDKSYHSIVLPNSGHQVWAAIHRSF